VLLGIDHVIFAVRDPDSAIDQLAALIGVAAGGGGRHEAHGTHNRLIWLGDSYIELMGVYDEELAGASWWGRQALGVIEGGGGYMGLALATDDLAADAPAGAEIVAGERMLADGRVVRWRIARPASAEPDLGLAFLIEHDTSAAEWTPAERLVRAEETPLRLRRLEMPVADMQRATMRVHRDLGVAFRPSLAGGGGRDGSIGRQTLRLVRSSSRPRVVLAGGAASERELLGCEWVIEP
jgi:hypothetical protein